jgi:hypothetical protein
MFGHHKLYHAGAQGRGVIVGLAADRLKRHDVGECHTGDYLPVRYDPRDHQKVVLDMPALEASKHLKRSRIRRASASG